MKRCRPGVAPSPASCRPWLAWAPLTQARTAWVTSRLTVPVPRERATPGSPMRSAGGRVSQLTSPSPQGPRTSFVVSVNGSDPEAVSWKRTRVARAMAVPGGTAARSNQTRLRRSAPGSGSGAKPASRPMSPFRFSSGRAWSSQVSRPAARS
jgi:hypothetical protein